MNQSVAAPPRESRAHGIDDAAPRPATDTERRWLAVTALLVLAAVVVPYVLGALAAPAGTVFGGALNNTGDLAQYLAMIRQGAEGHWLYRDQFTDLAAPRVLMFPLYAVLGQTLGRLGLAPLLVYHLGRVLCSLALVLALWWFCRLIVAGRTARRAAFILALLGTGLYWVALLVAGPLSRWGVQPVDLTAPEYSVFTVLLGSPHVALGLAAQLVAFGCCLRALGALRLRGRRQLWTALLAGAAGAVVVGLTYPFNLLPLALVLAVVALAAARRGGDPRPLLIAAAIAGPSLPLAFYYYALFRFDPTWRTSEMAAALPANPVVYLLAFGPLGLLALTGARRVHGARPPTAGASEWGWLLVAVWALVPAVLTWVPLWQAVRLANGWSIALALLAVPALLPTEAPPTRLPRRAARGVLFVSLSNVLLLALYCVLVTEVHPAGYYIPADLAAAGTWLAQHASERDVVLSSAGSGNVIVARSDVAVVAGQNFQTFQRAASLGAIADFFDARLPEGRRRLLLARHRVTYVLAGPWERALGAYDPARAPYLRMVLHTGRWRLFRVALPAAPGGAA